MDLAPQADEDIAALQSRIAALEAAGRHAEAMPLAERWVEAAKARFGEEHPSYAEALTTLARLLHRAGRLDEAEALLRHAIDICERCPDTSQALLAGAFGSLAQLLSDAGRLEEAEALRPLAAAAGAPDAEREPPPADFGEAAAPDEQPAQPAALPPAQPRPAAPSPQAAGAGDGYEPGALASEAARAPRKLDGDDDRLAAVRRRAEAQPRPLSASLERTDLPKPREKVDAKRALEIDAGRLAYQIPKRMWVGLQETVEVRLGRTQAQGLTQGFAGRGEVRTEDIPIVETMSVTLACEPGAFDIVPRSEKDQLVKPDLVLGTPFHSSDFGRWVWVVTPRQTGEHTLLVKVSAAVRDSRGLPTTAALPDKTFAVSVRVQLLRAAVGAVARAAPGLAWAVVTALVGVFTKDYWWPAIRHMIGLG